MPKNKGKGGKNRRRGTKNDLAEKRELIFKEEDQEYAQIIKVLGCGNVEASCFDGKKRICHIRGKLRKRVWVNPGDIVLISLRDFQNDRGDIIYKYTEDEARNLKKYGEFPETIRINENTTPFMQDGFDGDIEFDDGTQSSEDDYEPTGRSGGLLAPNTNHSKRL